MGKTLTKRLLEDEQNKKVENAKLTAQIQESETIVSELRAQLAEKNRKITELKSLITYSTGGGKSVIRENVRLTEERDQLKGENDSLRRILDADFFNTAIATTPEQISQFSVPPGENIIPITGKAAENTSLVSCTFLIHDGQGKEDAFRLKTIYPGSLQHFRKNVEPRVKALLDGKPLPEDNRLLAIRGVDDDTLNTAAAGLIVTLRLRDRLDLDYSEILGRTFRREILPHIDTTKISEDEARNRFGKLVKKIAEQVKDAGRW